jgi:hypothetical protein
MPESILREPSSDRSRKTTPCTPEITEVTSSGPFETTRAANYRALLRRRVRSVYRRCQRVDTRSFHGLCSPPRSTCTPLQPGPCQDRQTPTGRSPLTPSVQDRFLRPMRAPLGSLPRLPLETSAAPHPRVGNDAEERGEPGGRSRLRATRLFSAPSEAQDRSLRPLVRPKPSSRAGKCRRSLSGGEVVSPWTAMHSAAAASTREWKPVAAAPRGRSHQPS